MGGEGLHKWFSRNGGKGWIDCHASRKVGLYAFVFVLRRGTDPVCREGQIEAVRAAERERRQQARVSCVPADAVSV